MLGNKNRIQRRSDIVSAYLKMSSNAYYGKRNMYQRRYTKKTYGRRGAVYGARSGYNRTNSYQRKAREVKTFDSYKLIQGNEFRDNIPTIGSIDVRSVANKVTGPELGTAYNQRIGNKVNNLYTNMKMTFVSAKTVDKDSEIENPITYTTIGVPEKMTTGTIESEQWDLGATTKEGAFIEAIQKHASNFEITRDDDTIAPTWVWKSTSTGTKEAINTVTEESIEDLGHTRNSKFIRTQHRITVFKDRQERSDINVLNENTIFEPALEGVNLGVNVLSNYNAQTSGRFEFIYDKVFTTNAGEPVKTVVLNNLKTNGLQRWEGAAQAWGSLWIIYTASIPGATSMTTISSKPKAAIQIRQKYVD